MADWKVEVNVMAAEDLKNVKLIGKMRTYVVAWINPDSKVSTRVSDGGRNPSWNEIIKLPIEKSYLERGQGFLTFEIFSSSLVRPSPVGSVRLPIAEISYLAGSDPSSSVHQCRPRVIRRSGRVQGTLSLAIRLTGETRTQLQPTRLINTAVEVQSRPRPSASTQFLPEIFSAQQAPVQRIDHGRDGSYLTTYRSPVERQLSKSAPSSPDHLRRAAAEAQARLNPPAPADSEKRLDRSPRLFRDASVAPPDAPPRPSREPVLSRLPPYRSQPFGGASWGLHPEQGQTSSRPSQFGAGGSSGGAEEAGGLLLAGALGGVMLNDIASNVYDHSAGGSHHGFSGDDGGGSGDM